MNNFDEIERLSWNDKTSVYIEKNKLYIDYINEKYIFDEPEIIQETLILIEEAFKAVIENEDNKSSIIENFFEE